MAEIREDIHKAWAEVVDSIPDHLRSSLHMISPEMMMETLNSHVANEDQLKGKRNENYYINLKTAISNLMAKLGFHPYRDEYSKDLQKLYRKELSIEKKTQLAKEKKQSMEDLILSPSTSFFLSMDSLIPKESVKDKKAGKAIALYLKEWHREVERMQRKRF